MIRVVYPYEIAPRTVGRESLQLVIASNFVHVFPENSRNSRVGSIEGRHSFPMKLVKPAARIELPASPPYSPWCLYLITECIPEETDPTTIVKIQNPSWSVILVPSNNEGMPRSLDASSMYPRRCLYSITECISEETEPTRLIKIMDPIGSVILVPSYLKDMLSTLDASPAYFPWCPYSIRIHPRRDRNHKACQNQEFNPRRGAAHHSATSQSTNLRHFDGATDPMVVDSLVGCKPRFPPTGSERGPKIFSACHTLDFGFLSSSVSCGERAGFGVSPSIRPGSRPGQGPGRFLFFFHLSFLQGQVWAWMCARHVRVDVFVHTRDAAVTKKPCRDWLRPVKFNDFLQELLFFFVSVTPGCRALVRVSAVEGQMEFRLHFLVFIEHVDGKGQKRWETSCQWFGYQHRKTVAPAEIWKFWNYSAPDWSWSPDLLVHVPRVLIQYWSCRLLLMSNDIRSCDYRRRHQPLATGKWCTDTEPTPLRRNLSSHDTDARNSLYNKIKTLERTHTIKWELWPSALFQKIHK